MNNIIHIIQHTARTATVLLLALLTAQTVWAQDLSALKVFTEVPTVTSGQSSNWKADMENGENYNKLVDGNTDTKYGLDGADPWVEFYYAQPITPNGYALWTANDYDGQRNPKNWTIKAKNAADTDWTTLVSIDNSSNDKLPMANDTETRFALQNSTAYQYFRFEATRNADTGQFQLAELQFLYTDDPSNLQFAGISGISSRYAYTGEAIPVTFSVAAADGTALTLGTHYTATLGGIPLESNTFGVIDEGSYTVSITAKDGSVYSGSTSKTFSVVGMKAIDLPSVAHGTVSATVNGEAVTQAMPGDEVTLTIAWDEGYEFRINGLTDANGNNVEKEDQWIDNSCIITFTMPETAVTFDATISEKLYWVNTPDYGEKFSITANPSSATKESLVTLTISKADGVTMSNLKASYRDKSGSSVMKARRIAPQGEDTDDEYTRYLELTKISETQYTFTMPAADVSVKCDVSYTGQYVISRAEGLPEEALCFTVSGIEVTSANAGDEVWLNYSGSASNISVMGASTGNAVTIEGDHFTMPTEAVTVSAEFKYQLFYRTEDWYSLTATANGTAIPAWGVEESYIAPGTEVTLTAKSSDANIILSYLQVSGYERGQVPLTDIVETSEDGFPHVYTTTFVMPYGHVSVNCNFGNPITVTFDANGGEGTMEAITIGQGGIIFLPECNFTRDGYTFAGWKLPMFEEIQPAGREVGLPYEDVTCIAQWTKNELTLADASDNNAAISAAADDGKLYAVTLSGRTLYKDGSWNTLCLPFSVSTASGTLSGDGVKAMTLNTTTSNLADGTLTLNFDAAETIPAGTPFIIKWDNTGVNIENPVFEDVTIDATNRDATVEDVLTFTGTYAPVSIPAAGDNTKLYLGAANKLYYPNAAMTIGTHRAYFQLSAGKPAGTEGSGEDVRAFVLNFDDDEATGILTTNSTNSSNEWYTLDGVKLAAKPTAKGLYIHGGKKVAIK